MFGYPERPLADHAAARLRDATARRAARVPLAHILGIREFWSLPFRVTRDVLVPRPDSETLVAAALDAGLPDGARLLDLGTGSGCLLLALLHERPDWTGVGVDRSPAALAVAQENARALGLADRAGFVAGDWTAPLASRFDAILSNPPYVRSADLATLDPEVRDHDPALALDGGADGLEAYRRIVAEVPRLLRAGGRLGLEVGGGQAAAVSGLMAAAGFGGLIRRHDLGGVARCLTGTLKRL